MILLDALDFAEKSNLVYGMAIVIVSLAGVIVALFAYIKQLVKNNTENLKTLVQSGIESNIKLTTAVTSLDNTNQKILNKVDQIFIDAEVEKRIQKSTNLTPTQ